MQGLNCVALSLLKLYSNYSLDFTESSTRFVMTVSTSCSQWNCNCNFQCAPNQIMSCSWFDRCGRKSRIFQRTWLLFATKKHSQKCRQLDGAVAGRSRLTATVRGSLLKYISQIFYCLYFLRITLATFSIACYCNISISLCNPFKPVFSVNTKKC